MRRRVVSHTEKQLLNVGLAPILERLIGDFRYPQFLLVIILVFHANSAVARRYDLLNKPLDIYGQVSQSFAFGWHDQFDTEQDINSAIWTGLLEGLYSPTDNFQIFGQFILTGDMIYGFKANDDSWREKQFNQSWQELALDDSYWQILKEFHVTWTPAALFSSESANRSFRGGRRTASA